MASSASDSAVALLDAVSGQGTVLLLGATDSGKTTLALGLANAAVATGIAVAVVDADVGQSEIGPPGTLGVALPRAPLTSFDELRPASLAFVGSNTPARHLLPVVVGTRRLVDEARRQGAALVIVDTSGLVDGELGQALKLHKIDLLAPDLVVGLQRREELEPILRLAAVTARVERTPVSPQARPKPPSLRRARRTTRFARYFEGAVSLTVDARAIPLAGAWLFQGQALEPRLLRFAERTLVTAVPHAEKGAGVVHLVARGTPPASALSVLREEFRTARVMITPPQAFQGLLLGLVSPGGILAAIGILEGVAFDTGRLTIRTPLVSTAGIAQVRLGRLRLRSDGSEIGMVRPGEL